MKRKLTIIICLLMLSTWSIGALPISAQTSEGGSTTQTVKATSPNNPPPLEDRDTIQRGDLGAPPNANSPSNPVTSATVMNILWRVRYPRSGATDYMTTADPTERDNPLYQPSDGQLYYVPKYLSTGRAVFNRLLWSVLPDHMDSTYNSEASYTFDKVLGYPWTSSTGSDGLAQLDRAWNNSPGTGDHALLGMVGGVREPLPNYTQDPPFGDPPMYGYPRYFNHDDTDSQAVLNISYGNTTVTSDLIGGGCVTKWVYYNPSTNQTVNYIDNTGYGRELQVDFWFYDNNLNRRNPTECGDGYASDSGLAPQKRHGSPLISASNNNTTHMQSTRAVPLDWDPDVVLGQTPDHPVVDSDIQVGKDLQLNYNNWAQVAKYDTKVWSKVDIDLGAQQMPLYFGDVTMPGVGYGAPHEFSNFWTYDAGFNDVEPVDVQCSADGYRFKPYTGWGGIIVGDHSYDNAMGIFGQIGTATSGGPVDFFKFGKVCGTGTRNLVFNTAYQKRLIPGQTWNTYTNWIITGTQAQVVSYMRQLYCSFVVCGSTQKAAQFLGNLGLSMLLGPINGTRASASPIVH